MPADDSKETEDKVLFFYPYSKILSISTQVKLSIFLAHNSILIEGRILEYFDCGLWKTTLNANTSSANCCTLSYQANHIIKTFPIC